MAKTTTTRSRTPKAEPVVVEEAAENTVEKAPSLRKKELIDRVVAASGMKKKDVKPVVEATLAVLGQALSDEEPMNLQPLGKVIINRRKELANGEVLITRIRRSSRAVEAVETPLADPQE